MFREDNETFAALNALYTIVKENHPPLVIWLGAGVSAWAGYPLWKELAERMHTRFSREVPTYNQNRGSSLLKEAAYPSLFEEMKTSDSELYFSTMKKIFAPKPITLIHKRLLSALEKFSPIRILTTNVDETLEKNLPLLETIQHSDIERIPQLLSSKSGFVAKLHGSISSVQTMVFTEQEYCDLEANQTWLSAVRSVFSLSAVLFLGYGLKDQHVVAALQNASASHPLFGLGPNFIVTPEGSCSLPVSVRRISYIPDQPDHRSAIETLEAVREEVDNTSRQTTDASMNEGQVSLTQSIYYIADLVAFGTVTTSQTAMIRSESDAHEREMVIGEGYVEGEVILRNYSALHDVVVGLVCFDVIVVSVNHLGLLHSLVGSSVFWRLVGTESLRIVAPPSDPSVIFPYAGALVGDLGVIERASKAGSCESFRKITLAEKIREQIHPLPGNEIETERRINFLETTAVDMTDVLPSGQLAYRTRSVLMRPSIRRMLGISDGTPRRAVPRWVMFPVMRLARVIRNGFVCQHIGACATRMIWGTERLATAAFSASAGSQWWVDEAASYALIGRYNSDLGAVIEKQPSLLDVILRFRESMGGVSFRREVMECLNVNRAGEVEAAINSGLRQALSVSVLEQARDQLSGLFVPREGGSRLIPAFWGDLRNADERIAGWRRVSKSQLRDICKKKGINQYDTCPCGSGEKLRFCCGAALR